MSDELRYLRLEDWLAVKAMEAQGVPGMDAGRRPISEHRGRGDINVGPTPPVPQHYPVAFSLRAPSTSARDRRRVVDRLLADVGIRKPRRW